MRTSILVLALVAAGCGKNDKSESPPTPPDKEAPLDTSCTTDADCVPAPDCCPAPCTSDVINRKDMDRARKQVAKNCPKDQQCPTAGSCMGHLYVCEAKQCKIVYEGDPAYQRRQKPKE